MSRQLCYDADTFHYNNMSHVMRKPVFEVCDQVRLKPVCSAKGAS